MFGGWRVRLLCGRNGGGVGEGGRVEMKWRSGGDGVR